jgi:hypothetical protein
MPSLRVRGNSAQERRRRGARFAVTESSVPQPGEPAPRRRNILAAGFRAAYVRQNWAFPA